MEIDKNTHNSTNDLKFTLNYRTTHAYTVYILLNMNMLG